MSKKKILIISDHALSPTGVGVQTKLLAEGLLSIGDYMILQLGAAIKHQNYNTVKVCDDFYIKPIDGFGDPNLLRSVLLNEQPDALIIFTDPRFFTWLFEIEDEIKQVCPILWWHVWDNLPYPKYNNWMYEATDVINCHSYLTYQICQKHFPEKTNFIPHAFPEDKFFRLKDEEIRGEKSRILGESRKNNFVCLWINRNCKRKRPGDVLVTWKKFVDKLGEDRKNLTLLMHTDPCDKAGQNLFEIGDMLDILDNVAFSTEKLNTSFINILHNIADVCINISFNEGFGLTTLESMMVGTPIIAAKTGGLYRQVIDCNDKSENGVGLDIKLKTIAGNQNVPYIYEDYVDVEDAANAIHKLYMMNDTEKKKLSLKVEKYAKKEFNYNKTITDWDESIKNAINKHKSKDSNIEVITL